MPLFFVSLLVFGFCCFGYGICRAAGAIHDKLARHFVCAFIGQLHSMCSVINIVIYHVDPLIISLADIDPAPKQTENLLFNIGRYDGLAENGSICRIAVCCSQFARRRYFSMV